MRRAWIIICLALAAGILLASAADARASTQRDKLVIHDYEHGVAGVDGTLDGVDPGDETVRILYVTRIGPEDREGLWPLLRFKHLEHLELELVRGVDLSPLAQLDIEVLALRYVRNVDLTPLGALDELRTLIASDLRDVVVPPVLTLAPTLRTLILDNAGYRETAAPIQALIQATNWPALGGLAHLALGVEEGPPAEVDLGFLRSLPRLTRLDIPWGVHHLGPAPSPLLPPFDGLSKRLDRVTLDAWKPKQLERALERRHPRATSIVVDQRYPYRPDQEYWQILRPTRHDPTWSTYGSLWEAFDGRYGTTESEALAAARRLLRREAPALLRRLDFDSESDGTGIGAPTRRDLVRFLRLIGAT